MRVSLIIIAIAFLTIAPSIYVGIKYFDGKVNDAPYENGLKYNETKNFINDNKLALSVVKIIQADGKVKVVYSVANDGETLINHTAVIARPAEEKDVVSVAPVFDETGAYTAEFASPKKGYYVLKAKFAYKGKDISLEKSFYIN